ncbi:Phosphoglucan phosphatase DSP4, chloroplastic [Ancistrocladus abbreviatus]
MPLKFEKEKGSWILEKELPEGCYEYKYIVDGEWKCNKHELVTPRNEDGHVNNYVQVFANDPDSDSAKLRKRLTGEDPVLTMDEQLQVRQFLEGLSIERLQIFLKCV